MSEPAIQSINQHTQKTSLDWLYNILIQPSTGTGSGVAPAVHEQYNLSLDLLRQALVEVENVVNVLTTAVPGKVLDARQGKVLADAIAAILAQKAAANGLATLGSDGKIPSAQIPSIALVDVFPVSSEAAMLASGAEQGDMAIRSDTSQVFILSASPATTLSNWVELSALKALVDAHAALTNNPHSVTKEQVGLGNADNTSDADKPVSTAQQAELDLKIPLAQKGQASGVATLGADGLVPSAQLPSYVDDVLEYDSLSLLPETGETSKIYVTLDTNLTYRWSGSGYTEISKSLALGETEATAYRGDRGKTAYDHTLLADNPHSVTKEQVGLGNADNTSDADKPVSTAQQAELDLKIPLTQKAAANGIATLGSDGKIPSAQIPSIALVDVFPVSSEAAMLASGAEQGDMAIRSDTSQVFILSASPATTLSNWVELSALKALVDAHAALTNNPHSVTKEQVGLGNADNTSDADKPVSTAQQAELDLKIPLAQKGQASGVATLGADGLVPSAQLPSYVDDVLEYDSLSLLPETGETSKIYVTLDTNLTYRWSGSGYTEISKSLALGETEATAYRGDRGKTAYDHTLLADNPHSVTKEQVGLGNADNTSDADKPVSTAQQAELDLKIPLTQKAAANGIATLGSDGKIPSAQIPSIALVDVFPVSSEAAMLASGAEQGDMAIRSDTSQVFILSASPATTLSNWVELSALKALVDAHAALTNNPHSVTKEQVGLGNADNTSDADKPVSTAQQAELDLKIPLAQKGQASGVATLGADGLVPSAQLPSYVDDVLEYDSLSLLPETGETSKIYVTLDTNLTYRWSGSGYTEISKSLALGETEATAYRGDRGKTAYDHTLLADNPHSVTKEQVGLGNADNTSDADKPVSTAQQAELDLKIPLTQKAAANGIATLGSDGKIPSAQIPSIALVDVFPVSSEAAMLASGAEQGDMAIRSDTSQVFILSASPATTLSNWVELSALKALVDAHAALTNNPHSVTKEQVGLGNADNTSDADKPVSTAQQAELDLKIPLAQKGQASGVATLGADGLVPSAQLPSYVDDVLEYDSLSLLPETGETSKIYVTLDTNLTYRWSGSGYTEISKSLALGETEATAYRGDRGKTAYDHTLLADNPHSVTKEQVGLGNADNTSDADKPVSTAQQAELDLKIPLTQKAAANGIATLGSDGKIPSAQIPSIALVDVFPVSSEAAMLASGAEQGDMAIRSDTSQVFILSASPASTLSNWVELSALKALVDAHAALTNNPHAVTKAQVGLGSVDNTSDSAKPVSTAQQAALDNKESVANVDTLKGSDWAGETVKQNADALTTLNGDDTTAGSVLKSIKEQAQKGDFAPTVASGIESETLEEAVNEVGVDVAQNANEIASLDVRLQLVEGVSPKVYGFKKHKLSGACTPIYDSVALGPVPVIRGDRPVGFVNPYKDINIFHWRSCLMNTRQQILAYYGQAGYDTPTHDSQSYEVEIPKAYIKQWEDESYTYRIISESLAIEGMFVPGAFRDDLGQEMPFAYVDKYRRGVLNGYSVSRPDVLPEVSQNIIQFETKAEAVDDTMLWTGSPEELDWYITFVAEIMACNTNSQAAYGQGMSSMPYSASHTVVSVTTDANTVIVSNSTANAFKVSMNVKLGSALGSGQTFEDRFIQSITDNGDGTSTVVVDGDPFTTVVGYILHAHRQVTTSYEAEQIGEDCGFILHNGRPEHQVENWINGVAGHGGNVYEFSFGVLRHDNYVYLCHDRYQFKHNGDPRTNPAFVVSGFFEDSATYGWIKNMVLTGTPPYVMEWIDGLGASDITHYGDVAYYLNPSYRGTRALLRRLYWRHGSGCGRRAVYGYLSLSSAAWDVGWRASPSKLAK